MSLQYLPISSPDISSTRNRMIKRVDVDPDKVPLLDPESDEQDNNPTDTPDPAIQDPVGTQQNESMSYSPNFANFSSPISNTNRDDTDLNKDNPSDDSLLKTKEDAEDQLDVLNPDEELQNYVPSEVVDYYNEAAMTAKQRNQLPASEFGIPRLRAYPLNDEKHVRLAIQMFSHCKNEKDRAKLAKRIFKKIKAFDMDVKIGKDSALYDYAPKALQEATLIPTTIPDDDGIQVYGMEKPLGKRTDEEIKKEHLVRNAAYYNHAFYSNDFSKSLKTIENFAFFDYFYPNFKTHTLYGRLKNALGSLGYHKEVYQMLGMRYPFDTDFTKPIGWKANDPKNLDIAVSVNYDVMANWFMTDTSDNLEHVFFCLRLYSILSDIMLNPNFEMSNLSPEHTQLLMDWSQLVVYHYDQMERCQEGSDEYFKEAQYLFDLCWAIGDHPLSQDVISSNIMTMANMMAAGEKYVNNMNESTDLISKEDLAGYMVHELGMDDDIFLLPTTLEYPVIDKSSVRMAMDCIQRIPVNDRKTYATNLNRKYKELGCTFSISIDHPYAKYADQNIIDHMNRILAEGDTVVDDQGTSASPSDRATSGQPWYNRVDITGTVGQDLLQNKELGPNDKKYPDPTFTRGESLF